MFEEKEEAEGAGVGAVGEGSAAGTTTWSGREAAARAGTGTGAKAGAGAGTAEVTPEASSKQLHFYFLSLARLVAAWSLIYSFTLNSAIALSTAATSKQLPLVESRDSAIASPFGPFSAKQYKLLYALNCET